MRKFWDFWDHQRDVISLKFSEIFKEAVNVIPTKRNILSIIASVYDPEQNNVPEVMKEGTCTPKREAAELTKGRMHYAPGIN